MTFKDGTCEVCGGKEFIAGVASSPLGPCSFCYCSICLAMGADPKWWVESIVEENCGGIENVHPNLLLTYFENDSYKDFRTKKVVPIVTNDGIKFQTRSEFIEYHTKKNNSL